ncbi:hypothetical protein RHMOL_Rhmol10G0256800 [Rhododendron molle]|uniref:Uncharacterized protein n=1 Tax=Rhododendron molle TaxID=49168 RepID=A0ACC0M5W6_RHOML|nr:hypothetical protein RHMOL_Rhmol10G0256800 [Rhododendron molle]
MEDWCKFLPLRVLAKQEDENSNWGFRFWMEIGMKIFAEIFEIMSHPLLFQLQDPFEWHQFLRAQLRIDGAYLRTKALLNGGGLIGHKSKPGERLRRKIGRVSPVDAELWAIRDGLSLAAPTTNITDLEVETDAKAAIALIIGNALAAHRHTSHTNHDCRLLMQKLGIQTINHIYREGNRCADPMAKLARDDQGETLVIFSNCPTVIEGKLLDVILGVPYPRVELTRIYLMYFWFTRK